MRPSVELAPSVPVKVMSAAMLSVPFGVSVTFPSEAVGQEPMTPARNSMFSVALSMQELLAVQLPTGSPPHGATPHEVPPLLPHPAVANDSASPANAGTTNHNLAFRVTSSVFMGAKVARVAPRVKRPRPRLGAGLST